jgi:threonine dehydratase
MNLSEQEIADAMVSFLQHHGKLVEGAAGCAVAAVRQLGARLSGKRVVVVCCGGNVALSTLQRVLATGEVW